MQQRDRPGRALQLPVVQAERAHRLPAATHQQIVERALVCPGQRPEFGRQGEGQQKVFGRHLLAQLAFQPLLTLMVLTVWAVAMAAGVRDQHLMLASGALDLHLRAGLRAAVFHRRERAHVVGSEAIAVLRPQVRFEGFDDRGKPDHLTCLQAMVKPSIKTLIRSRA